MHPNPSAYTRATPRAIRTAKPSRYARVYSGTPPNPVISYGAEGAGVSQNGAGGSRATWTGQVARPSERERASQTPYKNSLTSDFSSFNSATDASIFERLKSFIGTPCTISHFPSRTRTGNDEIKPCSTP